MRHLGKMCPANAKHNQHPADPQQSRDHAINPRSDPTPARAPTGADLGRTIRRLRRERKLNIEGLAFASGVHPTYVSAIERGTRNPSWEKARSLAHGLGVPIAYLAARAESTARIRQGTEDILQEERARLARQPPDWAREDAA
jgi:transcriptional regulator with XRE-family HTH domain